MKRRSDGPSTIATAAAGAGRPPAAAVTFGRMDHVRLGRTGLLVSELCLGTMTFGLQCDETTSVAILDRAAEGGITFIDTADVYPLGGGPRHGRAAPRRSSGVAERQAGPFIVATKCFGRTGPAPGTRASPASTSWRPSRRRCGGWAPTTSTSTSCTGPTPARRSTRRWRRSTTSSVPARCATSGCSNFLAYQVARALGRSEARAVVRFDSVQPRYNLLFRQIERELLPLCAEEGVGVIPYNPIAGGLLSGKHDRGAAARGHALHPGQRRRRSTRTATGTTRSSPRSRNCARSPSVKASRW